MRKALVAILLLGATAVMPAAHADPQCPSSGPGENPSDIVLFSGTGLLLNLGAEGCLIDDVVWGGDHGPGSDTNIITPGSTTFRVRYLVETGTQPTGTLTPTGSLVVLDCVSSTPSIEAPPCMLTFTGGPNTNTANPAPDYWDSQTMSVQADTTIQNGGADVTVNGNTKDYRTLLPL